MRIDKSLGIVPFTRWRSKRTQPGWCRKGLNGSEDRQLVDKDSQLKHGLTECAPDILCYFLIVEQHHGRGAVQIIGHIGCRGLGWYTSVHGCQESKRLRHWSMRSVEFDSRKHGLTFGSFKNGKSGNNGGHSKLDDFIAKIQYFNQVKRKNDP